MKKVIDILGTIKAVGAVVGKYVGLVFIIGVGFIGLISFVMEFFKDSDD